MIARHDQGHQRIPLLAGTLILAIACAAHTDDRVSQKEAQTRRAVQISMEARLICLPQDVLREQKLVMNIALEQGNPANARLVDDDAVNKLVRAAQDHIDAATLTAPRAVVADGQKGSIRILQSQAYLSGYGPPKPDGQRDAIIATANSGITLNLQPTASDDRRHVALQFHLHLSHLRKLDLQLFADDPKLTIQKPDLASQEIAGVVSIPDRGTLLTLLGSTLDQPGQVVLMLVKPAILPVKREREK